MIKCPPVGVFYTALSFSDSLTSWFLQADRFTREHWRYVHHFWHVRSFSERVEILLLVPVSLIAAWLAYSANRHARSVARASRVFAKSEPKIFLFGRPLDAAEPAIDLWCFLHPGKFTDVAIYSLPFTIENHGDAALRDAIFTFEAGWEGVLEDRFVVGEAKPAVMADELNRAVGPEEGHTKEASHRIPVVGAKSAGIVSELVRLMPTIDRPHKTKTKLPDGRGVTLTITTDIVVLCRVRLFNEDIHLDYPFKIAAIRASSLHAARDVIAKKRNENEEVREKWKRVVFIKPGVLQKRITHGRQKGFLYKPEAEVDLLDVKYPVQFG